MTDRPDRRWHPARPETLWMARKAGWQAARRGAGQAAVAIRQMAATGWARQAGRVAAIGLVAVIGGWLGAALAPSSTATVGPIRVELHVGLSINPGVRVLLPPAGRVEFTSHYAPVAVEARVAEVDLEEARALVASQTEFQQLAEQAPDDLRRATIRAAVMTSGCALLGAVALALLVYRRTWRRTAEVAGSLVGVLVATAGLTAMTFDADRFAQPRFTGLLSQAPYLAGSTSGLLDRLESYRSGLADIVQGVTSLYATAGDFPILPDDASGELTTVLHVSDIHLNPIAFDLIERLVDQFQVDLVIDTGDITTWGTEVENNTLSRIGGIDAPYVLVRGNHDSARTQAAVARNPNAVVLDDEVREVAGVVVAGIGDPVFTPDETDEPPTATEDGAASQTGSTPSTSTPIPTTSTPSRRTSMSIPGTSPTDVTGPTVAGPSDVTGSAEDTSTVPALEVPEPDVQSAAATQLADTIRGWNDIRPHRQVQIAAFHEPKGVDPLIGLVPTVLSGHLHQRSVRTEDGTLVMVQGSTGGAGISSGAIQRLVSGDPIELQATLVYLAKTGERAGRVVAYDEVTVGGFGLASVQLERHVVREDDVPEPEPSESPSP